MTKAWLIIFAVVLLLFALLSLGVLFMVNVFHLFGQCLELTGQPTAGAKLLSVMYRMSLLPALVWWTICGLKRLLPRLTGSVGFLAKLAREPFVPVRSFLQQASCSSTVPTWRIWSMKPPSWLPAAARTRWK